MVLLLQRQHILIKDIRRARGQCGPLEHSYFWFLFPQCIARGGIAFSSALHLYHNTGAHSRDWTMPRHDLNTRQGWPSRDVGVLGPWLELILIFFPHICNGVFSHDTMVCFVLATYHLHVLSMGLGLSAFTWLRRKLGLGKQANVMDCILWTGLNGRGQKTLAATEGMHARGRPRWAMLTTKKEEEKKGGGKAKVEMMAQERAEEEEEEELA